MRKQVLIADDYTPVRQAIKLVLSSTLNIEDYREAANGREAVEIAEQTKPDLIILDIGMPDMDGVTVAQHLKKSMPEVPIILFTMYDVAPNRARELGVDAVVSKEELAALRTQVQSLLFRGN